jgi:hypothetical protein
MSCGCSSCAQRDPRLLVRTGTSQVDRALAAPDPARLKIDERRPEHGMVFAPAYARHLPFVDAQGAPDGTWEEFFTADRSARLAAAATEDVSAYRTTVQELLRRLTDPELPASGPDMIEALGAVFDCMGTLARRLDALKEGLPEREPLRATLGNLIRSRLSPVLRQLIGHYLAGADPAVGVVDRAAPPATALVILGRPVEPFESLLTGPGLSSDWPEGVGAAGWAAYVTIDLTEPKRAYGNGPTEADKVNHLASHNLFTAASETFLAVYARVVEDAGTALRASLGQSDHHPHYALFLAFLRLLDHARDEVNTLTRKHLDFYYRRVLQLAERPAQPSQAHVLVELAKHVDTHRLEADTLLKAGRDVRFGLDRDLLANKAVVDDLRSLYRHHNASAAETLPFADGQIFADPLANVGESWSPFAKKTYVNGQLRSIDMPPAEVGFAVASHHLWLAEGTRTITLQVGETPPETGRPKDRADLRCRLTTAKGWLEQEVGEVTTTRDGLVIDLMLTANDPPVTPYDPAVHGYDLDTALPVLLVTLQHPDDAQWAYTLFVSTPVPSLTLTTRVDGIRTLALANDQGPIDASKPFLAFGSAPTRDSALVIGSQEVFQKSPTSVRLNATFVADPVAHDPMTTAPKPAVSVEFLNAGEWRELVKRTPITTTTATFTLGPFAQPPVTTPDLTPGVPYGTTSRAGFIRMRLDRGFGTDTYPVALAGWVAKGSKDAPPTAPVLPVISSLILGYDAAQRFVLDAPSESTGRLFHITPFGHTEARAASGPLILLFRAGPNELSEGELYLGVRGLQPPQNLALLFQVADGTANPLAVKPDEHLRWSYLRGDAWEPFKADTVDDLTDGLLASGVVTLAVPADATTEHTLMPRGRHWIRIAVASATDAVCRLVRISTQAVRATSTAPGADPATVTLPAGTISKLDTPDPAVKSVTQPYPTFGGRPVESPEAFDTRVSERLRHKDRAITLWDYEHLVLEAFPDLYQVRCLNHTRYEPTSCGSGGYSELAPGHVTVVTIPDLALPNPRDPLRPFTSLRVLGEVERLLRARMSCFAELHVRNPQFEEVRVALRVRLRDGVDETFHLDRLEREITEFLSPWAFRPDARPVFNGTVHRSVLVNFVEERSYVDYVTDVELFRKLPDASVGERFAETVVGSRAISILVSAPQHTIKAIHTNPSESVEDCACLPLGVS